MIFRKQARLTLKVLITPPVIVFVVSVLLLFFSLLQTYHIHPFTSDDVAWQTQLLSWRPFNGNTASQGSTAPFIDKLPYFILFDKLFTPSRAILFIESFFLEVFSFGFLYLSALYFLRRQGTLITYWTLLPFIWLASFGYDYAQLYLNSNWRGFDLGLTFLTFALIAALFQSKYRNRSMRKNLLWCLPVAIVTGVLVYSDPHFLYFTIAPLVAFTCWLFYKKVIGSKQLSILFIGVLASIVFAKIVKTISISSGIKIMGIYPVQFIDFNLLPSNIAKAIHGLLTIFGADFFGFKLLGLSSASAALNFIILGVITVLIYTICRSYIKNGLSETNQSKLWVIFLIALIVEGLLLFTLSTLSTYDTNTYRYFLVVVFAAVLILVLRIDSFNPTLKQVTLGVLLLATLGNVLISARHSGPYATAVENPAIGTNRANALNFDIIKALENAGVYKGYANYWQANVNTYLSKGKVSVLPTICAPPITGRFYWLVDQSRYQQPATRSFYLYDPDISTPPTCSIEQIEAQIGAPQRSIRVSNKIILLYDYDITSRI